MATADEAKTAAGRLLGPGAVTLLESDQFDWDDLLPAALTFDDAGLAPGQEGYVDSYDPSWLAAEAASQFAVWAAGQRNTKKLSVDGDSIEADPAQWSAVAYELYRKSPLYKLQSPVIHVNGALTEYVPTSFQVP